jgi:hypothetical protein
MPILLASGYDPLLVFPLMSLHWPSCLLVFSFWPSRRPVWCPVGFESLQRPMANLKTSACWKLASCAVCWLRTLLSFCSSWLVSSFQCVWDELFVSTLSLWPCFGSDNLLAYLQAFVSVRNSHGAGLGLTDRLRLCLSLHRPCPPNCQPP